MKTWDRTTFSETGFRSTKKSLKVKEKETSKGKGVAQDNGRDYDFDDDEMEFEQFPTPHIDGECTLMSRGVQ